MKPKKKFPLPRPGRRKPSPDHFQPSASERSARSGGSNGSGGSGRRTRSLTPKGFSRKPSFRFGRKKMPSRLSPHGVDDDVSGASDTNISLRSDGTRDVDMSAGLPPALPTKEMDDVEAWRIQQQTPLTPMAGAAKVNIFDETRQDRNNQNTSTAQSPQLSQSPSSLSTQLPRTRSLTPSDYHYHTAREGGCNAPLTPITQHYQTNETLLDLFSTLYEKDQFSVAYAVGVKFVEVALFQIPTHGYYRSGSASKERTKSAADALKVTKMLGGMVDEMEEDEEGVGGLEKVERLSKLASVAHDTFEEALDDELKHSGKKREQRDGEDSGAAAQVSRLWNEYIMGAGDGLENHNLCSMPHLPDNICSFLNIGGKKNSNHAVDDAVMEDPTPAKKRSKIDRKSLPPQPEPIVIPQVFIKKESESIDEDMPCAESAEPATAITTMKEGTRRLPNDLDNEAPSDEEADTTPMEVDVLTPKTRPSEHKASDATSGTAQSRRDSTLSILTELGITTVEQDSSPDESKAEPTLVVKGRPVESHRPVDTDGFDKDDLILALSLSKSMEDDDVPNIVSSSSEDGHSTTAIEQSTGGIASLTSLYEEQYQVLRGKNKFHVRFLDTFQGRNPKSTNGCTVIAPLTCIQYFTSHEQNSLSSASHNESMVWKNGIPDELINQVIDDHAATVLPEVRGKLNLEADSFIIPSDVHDHLIEVGLLSTSQFVGVCGGNVLDDDHLSSFKRSLLLLDDERERERLKGRKIGATFFFHGHVIALHVVNGGNGDVWIELIDSLPNPETWINCSSPPSNHASKSSSHMSEDTDEEWERPMEYEDEDIIQNAIRVRCTDVEHFDTLVRHYCCSKFSSEERQFIDATEWDDNAGYCESSFDPRVFQAFIWAESA